MDKRKKEILGWMFTGWFIGLTCGFTIGMFVKYLQML